MQIDCALILSAGKGTRMGEIGTKMPKALWPIYSKKLLELQIDYCRDMGINKIYINTYYLSEEIESFIQTNEAYKNVTLLKEDPLLDSGGAIHNLAVRPEINYQGNVLLINADQFLLFDKKCMKKALETLEDSRAVLFGIEVDRDSHYNETIIANSKLQEITKPTGERNYITYSGNGILKLDGLKPRPGVSKFFESVADYKNETILFYTPENYEYWDFGTLEIYKENIFKIFKLSGNMQTSMMIQFLKRHNALNDLDSFTRVSDFAICLDNSKKFKAGALTFKNNFYFN